MIITETKRLIVEEAVISDANFFLHLLNSPNWLQYIGDRKIESEEAASQYIITNITKSYNNNGYGLCKLTTKEEKIPVDICGFVKRDYLAQPDLGFALLPQFERNGYAYEAAKTLLEYGFGIIRFSAVFAITTIENIKSSALLLKLGFQESGIIRPDITLPPVLLYSI